MSTFGACKHTLLPSAALLFLHFLTLRFTFFALPRCLPHSSFTSFSCCTLSEAKLNRILQGGRKEGWGCDLGERIKKTIWGNKCFMKWLEEFTEEEEQRQNIEVGRLGVSTLFLFSFCHPAPLLMAGLIWSCYCSLKWRTDIDRVEEGWTDRSYFYFFPPNPR